MHEATRRSLCRIGFLLGCLLPLLATVTWIGYLRTPWHHNRERAAWNAELSRRLGLAVTVDRVEHVEPGVTSLLGVALCDPETGEPWVMARSVEVARQGTGWIVYVGSAEVRPLALAPVSQRIHDQILRAGMTPLDAPCQVVIDAVQLPEPAPGQTWNDVQVTWQPRAEGPLLAVDFRLAGWPMSRPARITAVRNRTTTPPETRWELDSGPQDLPCRALAELFPPLAGLGPEALARGQWTLAYHARGWEGEGQGHLSRVDLDHLLTGRFPHKLTGQADITLAHLRWVAGRVVDAEGSLSSTGGVISYSLLAAAAEPAGLRLELADRVQDGQQPLWKYSALDVGFELTDQGLQVTGRCPDQPPGTLLSDARGPLVRESSEALVSVVGLVRTLAPQNEIQVPASTQTEQLLRMLPLPSLVPVAPAVARPSYRPLKLR